MEEKNIKKKLYLPMTEFWVRLGKAKFPANLHEFDDYLISDAVVVDVVRGAAKWNGAHILVKGSMPTMCKLFEYRLRVKKGADAKEFNILPKAGFVDLRSIPMTCDMFRWMMVTETGLMKLDRANMVVAQFKRENRVPEEWLRKQKFFKNIEMHSDYTRAHMIVLIRRAWPRQVGAIRKLNTDDLNELVDHLKISPHELCFHEHSKAFGLGELSIGGLQDILEYRTDETTTRPLHEVACRFYGSIKNERHWNGHTIFSREQMVSRFGRNVRHFQGGFFWMLREGYLYLVNEEGKDVDKEQWFDESVTRYLVIPRDYKRVDTIITHLNQVHTNFMNTAGQFNARHAQMDLPCYPPPRLTERQAQAADHILDNWLTIIQGTPGTGKTALGVEWLVSIFNNARIVTHVGRQSVELCKRVSDSGAATTIHSAYYHAKGSEPCAEWYEDADVLTIDECYNADDWTMEKALKLCSGATRIVLVGDPNQIDPIDPCRPALDIASAFPNHLIKLTENKRVDPRSIAISVACNHILHNQPQAIEWNDGCVDQISGNSVKERVFTLMDCLREDVDDVLDWQIITFFTGANGDRYGVRQLNALAQEYFDERGLFRGAIRTRINANLTLYKGMKIIFTEKSIPQHELIDSILNKKKKKKGIPIPTSYTTVLNGQMEIVKSARLVPARRGSPKAWIVKCESGVKFIINKKCHVSPLAVQPAWAITSNKCMGGECQKAGIFIPNQVASTFPNKSHLYVAMSRAKRWVGVIDDRHLFNSLAIRPQPVRQSALHLRLVNEQSAWAQKMTERDDTIRDDWKACYPGIQENHPVRLAMNIHDLSEREVDESLPICKPLKEFKKEYFARMYKKRSQTDDFDDDDQLLLPVLSNKKKRV
jgi:hypothetical protein